MNNNNSNELITEVSHLVQPIFSRRVFKFKVNFLKKPIPSRKEIVSHLKQKFPELKQNNVYLRAIKPIFGASFVYVHAIVYPPLEGGETNPAEKFEKSKKLKRYCVKPIKE